MDASLGPMAQVGKEISIPYMYMFMEKTKQEILGQLGGFKHQGAHRKLKAQYKANKNKSNS